MRKVLRSGAHSRMGLRTAARHANDLTAAHEVDGILIPRARAHTRAIQNIYIPLSAAAVGSLLSESSSYFYRVGALAPGG